MKMLPLKEQILSKEIWPFLNTDCLWIYRKQQAGAPSQETQKNLPFAGPFEAPNSTFLVEEGRVDLRIENRVITCKAGQWFLAAAGIRHQRIFPGTKILSVGYDANWFSGPPVFMKGLNCVVDEASVPQLHASTLRFFHKLYGECAERVSFKKAIDIVHENLGSYLLFKSAFCEWLAVMTDSFVQLGIQPNLIKIESGRAFELTNLMRKMPPGSPIDKQAITSHMGLSWRRIEQLFSENMGVTPHTFFERRRLKEAKRLLIDTDKSMKEIAFELGFKQASSFTIWFNRISKSTPSVYRKEVQALTHLMSNEEI